MSIIHKVTKTITGIEHAKNASEDTRSKLLVNSFTHHDPEIADRFVICSECIFLKEEFKLLWKTIKDQTPTCGKCGCNLNLKIPLRIEKCPENKW